MNDRGVMIDLGGQGHELLLTTRAAKLIGQRYGGVDEMTAKLAATGRIDTILEEIAWIIALLANQSIQLHNLRNAGTPKPLLTPEEVELLTAPVDLARYQEAITEAMVKGSRRHVLSQEEMVPNIVSG